ncbi:YD repeat-containing protein [Marinobacter lipolyticus SM19]|uniref:YD repeat-containing protein n=1 Tax=Marinobacter lipolyticus SM19 TaxID=1318628 RepID=R8B1S7_9GAMM|nr:RHS repeat-associated core domain-containing protein [Marinobacter lipolyticus]EON92524.1 YD repeat-containing protein [Marinobacter lipolyticus SM19]
MKALIRLSTPLLFLLFGGALLATPSPVSACANYCEHNPTHRDWEASITRVDTGEELTDGMTVEARTKIRIDGRAESFGSCDCYGVLENGECGIISSYNLPVHHQFHGMNISSDSLNGRYRAGLVYGKDESGTTAFYNVLDTALDNSTGPVYQTLYYPGLWKFDLWAANSVGACTDASPDSQGPINITLKVVEEIDDDLGPKECNQAVGEPIDVTNGNMYLQQEDFTWPKAHLLPKFVRTYNSLSSKMGRFGRGWTTIIDESISEFGDLAVRLNLADGGTVYFYRDDTESGYIPDERPGEFKEITKTEDGKYILYLLGGVTKEFDVSGRLTTITDLNNQQVVIGYDEFDRPASISQSFGKTLTLDYSSDTSSFVTSISDDQGIVIDYHYQTLQRLSGIRYRDGSGYDFTFSSGGPNYFQIASVKDMLGHTLESHIYDDQGRAITSSRHNDIEKVTLNYVSSSETLVTDALNNTTTYHFSDKPGRSLVTSVEGSCCGSSETKSWTYNEFGQIKTETDGLGNTISYSYDASGNKISETDPQGNTTQFAYNSLGQVISKTDTLGNTYTYTYDGNGNLLSLVDPLGNGYQHAYDSYGRILTSTDPNGNVTEFGYDAQGNLSTLTTPLGETTTLSHDSYGRILSVSDPLDNTSSYSYDSVGRLVSITHPDGNSVSLAYDAAGRLTSVTDELGQITSYTYDPGYRLTSVTNPAGETVAYGYDVMSKLTSVTDGEGRLTTYGYDSIGRLTAASHPAGGTFTYDAAGRLSTKTDHKGVTTAYSFDANGRLLGKTYSDGSPSVSYTYDAVGRLTSVANGAETLTYIYDDAGRLVLETSQNSGRMITYAYDPAGHRTSMDLSGAPLMNYDYNENGMLASVITNGHSFGYSYDSAGRHTLLTRPDAAIDTSFQYDNRSRLTSAVTSRRYKTLGDLVFSLDPLGNNEIFEELAFSFDPLGNILSKTSTSGTETYDYDEASRLTQVTREGANSESYAYDQVGNRIQSHIDSVWTYNSLNQLINHGSNTYRYDANGNLVEKDTGGSIWTYQWNAENRLVGVWKDGAPVANYQYDAFGRRISKTVAGITTSYVYSLDGLVAEINDANAIDTWYGYAPNAVWGSNPLFIEQGGEFGYYINDQLGAPLEVVSGNGTTIWQAERDAFGRAVVTTNDVTNNIRMPGQYYDFETGLFYNWHRYYDPDVGRYLQSDPVGLQGGLNTYAYVGGNPLIYVDPLGLAYSPMVEHGISRQEAMALPPNQDPCGCFSKAFLGYAEAGVAATEAATGPYVNKPRSGIAGGGKAGSKTSAWSLAVHQVNNRVGKNAATAAARTMGRVASRAVPYAGTALLIYDINVFNQCMEKCGEGECKQ